MGVGVGSSHIVSAVPSSLHSSPAPAWGPTHGLQFSTNFSKLESFRNRLLQRGSPTGSQALPANVHHHRLLSPQLCRSWQETTPAQAPHGVTASFRHPPAPMWGPFHGLQVEICSTEDLHGLQVVHMPHHGLHHDLQGKALCLSVSSTSSPSFFTDFGVCRVVSFTSSCSSLSTAVSLQFFLPLLNHVIPEALPPLLIGLALASNGSILELAGTGFIRHGGSFSQKPPL